MGCYRAWTIVPSCTSNQDLTSGDVLEEQRKHAILFAATLLCARTNVPPRGFMHSLASLNGLPNLRARLMLNWNSDSGEYPLSDLPLAYHRANGGPQRVCDDVRQARGSCRNESLKDFDRKTDCKSEENGYQLCAFQMQCR